MHSHLLMILATDNLVGNYLRSLGSIHSREWRGPPWQLSPEIAGGLAWRFFTGIPVRDLKRPGCLSFKDYQQRISVGVPSAIEQITIHTSQIVCSMITLPRHRPTAAHQIMHGACCRLLPAGFS